MCPLSFSYHVVLLTCWRYHSPRKSFTPRQPLLENANEDKNKKLNISLLEAESSVFRNECIRRLRAVSTRKNRITRRRIASARVALIPLSTGSRLEGGEKNTSNKIVKSEKISKEANHQKHQDEEIGYRSSSSESRFEICLHFLIYTVFLRGRSFQLPFVASNRNQPFKHLTNNLRRKPRAPNTTVQIM